MAEIPERRRGRRIVVPGRLGGRVRATLDARVLDLSTVGARIEHQNMLRPGFECTLELPPPMGGLILPVRVIRSTVVGTSESPAGERILRYESGLTFTKLTTEMQKALENVLGRLAPGGVAGDGRLVL